MSIFDKFNANPYIKTYAGAPINEAMQVVKGLNIQAQTNIDQMDKTQLLVNGLPALGNADKAFKQQYQQELQNNLKGIMEAPEHATQKVRALSRETAMNPTLAAMKTNAAKAAEWNEKYKEDPSKYGDVAAWQYQKQLEKYEAAGGAAGGADFKPPALYEQVDMGKWMKENGKEIAASSNGVSYVNGEFIHTKTQEKLSYDKVEAILMGAAAGDRNVMRQLEAERQMNNEITGNETGMEDFLKSAINPYANMFAFDKQTHTMKGKGGGKGKGTGFTIGQNMFDYNGADVKFDMTEDRFLNAPTFFKTLKEYEGSEDPRDVQRGMALRQNYRNAVNEMADRENMDPIVKNFLLEADIDDLPVTRQVYAGTTIKDGAAYTKPETDFSAFERYATARGMKPEQLGRMKQQIQRGLNGSMWQTDLKNTWDESNTLTMDTQFTHVGASLGLREADVKRMDSMFAGSLAAKDNISVINEDGEVEVMSGEDFRSDYNVATAKLISADTNGTGAVNMTIEDENGKRVNKMIIADPNNDQIFRVMGNGFAHAANTADNIEDRLAAARKGVNFVNPEITRSAEMLKGKPMGANGTEAVPIYFGAYNDIVGQRIGNITLKLNTDGDYVALKNGENLFANSPDFTNLAENAKSPQEMAVLINQYVRQNL